MKNEAWIENLKIFLPDEMYYIYKKSDSGITYVLVGEDPDPVSHFRLYYDYGKSSYTIVHEGRNMTRGSAYLTTDNLQLACACFIFMLSKYLPKYSREPEYSSEEWKIRKIILANELFDSINRVYGGLKEEDKKLIFRFWYGMGENLKRVDFDCSRRGGEYLSEAIQIRKKR